MARRQASLSVSFLVIRSSRARNCPRFKLSGFFPAFRRQQFHGLADAPHESILYGPRAEPRPGVLCRRTLRPFRRKVVGRQQLGETFVDAVLTPVIRAG